MISYQKFFKRIKKMGISSSDIRKYKFMGEATLTKLRNNQPLTMTTIEHLCQLLQCQPKDIMEWTVELDPTLSAKSIMGDHKEKKKTNLIKSFYKDPWEVYGGDELNFYMDLLESGITVDDIRMYMGNEVADIAKRFCKEHGLI